MQENSKQQLSYQITQPINHSTAPNPLFFSILNNLPLTKTANPIVPSAIPSPTSSQPQPLHPEGHKQQLDKPKDRFDG
jgi:hypothetical protein